MCYWETKCIHIGDGLLFRAFGSLRLNPVCREPSWFSIGIPRLLLCSKDSVSSKQIMTVLTIHVLSLLTGFRRSYHFPVISPPKCKHIKQVNVAFADRLLPHHRTQNVVIVALLRYSFMLTLSHQALAVTYWNYPGKSHFKVVYNKTEAFVTTVDPWNCGYLQCNYGDS